MSEEAVVIPIRMSSDQAEAQLEEFERVAKRRAANAADGVEKEGKRGFEGFIKSWRKEEKAEGRYSRFITGELAGLGMLEGEAGRVAGRLLFIFSNGFGIMAAVDLIKWGFEAITEETRKAKEEAKQWQAHLEQGARDLASGYRTALGGIEQHTDFTNAVTQALQFTKGKWDELNAAIEKNSDDRKKLKPDSDAWWANYREGERLAQERLNYWEALEKEVIPGVIARVQAEFQRRADVALTQEFYQANAQLQQAFYDKAKQLSREAALVGLSELEKVKAQLKFAIEDLRASGVGNLGPDGKRALGQAVHNATAISEEQARQIAFKTAKAQHDGELQAELAAQETQFAIDAQNEEARRKAKLLIQASWRKDIADRLDALKKGEDDELAILMSAQEQGIIGHEEYERRKLEITQRYAQQRAEALRKESALEQSLAQVGQAVLSHMSQTIGSAFASMATHSAAYERALIATGRAHKTTASEAEGAMWAQVQSVLAAAAAQAEVEAVLNLGRGFAAMASFNYKSAGEYFTAAAILGTVGGVAAAAGYAIGEYRPMTAEERQSLSDNGLSSGSNPRDVGPRSSQPAPARETILLIGDPFEAPAETARRAARAVNLAKQLDLMARDS